MKISLIATILNEEENIIVFLESLLIQSVTPYDVVIIDGGSTDQTVCIVKDFIKTNKLPFKFLFSTKKGNRSVGRNEAIKKAKGEIILISDSGCILDKDWVKEMVKPFSKNNTEVVAGFYDAKAKNIFEKCLVPYVLVMPDQVDAKAFLPATRSMAMTRKIWKEMGKFDERYWHNEDYVFALELKKKGKKIFFARKAIVYWLPRPNMREAFTMFRRYAYGDMEAAILRPKVVLIFCRYIIVLLLLIFAITSNSEKAWILLFILFVFYCVWAIIKNYKYIRNWLALYYLPIIQFLSDFAVAYGTVQGLLNMRKIQKTNNNISID